MEMGNNVTLYGGHWFFHETALVLLRNFTTVGKNAVKCFKMFIANLMYDQVYTYRNLKVISISSILGFAMQRDKTWRYV